MNIFELEILSPEGRLFKGKVFSASFPTSTGIITVLPGHENLVTKLSHGDVVVSSDKGTTKIVVSGGFIEISDHNVNVVAEFAAPSDEENRQKVKEAMVAAKEMKNKKRPSVDMSVIETQLKKSVFGLKSNLGIKRKK